MVAGPSAQLGVSFLYAIPVALATWWLGPRIGLGFAIACAGLFLIGAGFHTVHHVGGALAVRVAVLLAVVAAVGVVRSRLLRLEHSAEELEAIRAALTPPAMPVHEGVDVAAAFIPSELGVSGDFYLLTNSPDGSAVAVVGDVVGHGPKAAQLATFIRAQLATFAANSSDPAEILELANAALIERPGHREELVSAVCMRFHAPTRRLSWAVAGHPAPLDLPDLGAKSSEAPTLLLGVEAEISLTARETTLDPDGGVLVYTDGATDLEVERRRTLGLEGLRNLLRPVAHLPAESIVNDLEAKLLEAAEGSIRDDICVLVMRPS